MIVVIQVATGEQTHEPPDLQTIPQNEFAVGADLFTSRMSQRFDQFDNGKERQREEFM